jgi:hypothetical protein
MKFKKLLNVRFWHLADITRLSFNVRFWGFGAHIVILQAFSTLPLCYPHAYPLAEFARYSPSTCRRCSSRISSAMLVRDSRTSSANGAFGRHERHR